MSADIYQKIYDIDISQGSGVPAVLPGEPVDESVGYVVVDEAVDPTRPHQLLQRVVIPEGKQTSYRLARDLFDNYDVLSSVSDVIIESERAEADALLRYVIASAPMRLAREYVEARARRIESDEAWYSRVRDAWFRPFAVGPSPTRSGFEHVFLGEWKDGDNIVGGLHWWYFYFEKMSEISYGGTYYNLPSGQSGLSVPELATMSFHWTIEGRALSKDIGGFFIGPSVEGLMAMGMVRADSDAAAPNTSILQGMEVELKMFKSDDGRSVNTFYPVLQNVVVAEGSPATPSPTTQPSSPPLAGGGIRIVSAMTNPSGDDPGREKVTLLNMSGQVSVNLTGWQVQGPNKSTITFGDVSLELGVARTFVLPARGSLQLSNSGGTVALLRPNGTVEQAVVYDSKVAGVQNGVLVWDGATSLLLVQ